MSQMTLDFCTSVKSWRERANRWIDENPVTYGLFVKFALRAARRNERIGVKMIAERVRWECAVEKSGEYKVNNNYVSYIARRMIQDYPELKRLIETREVRS